MGMMGVMRPFPPLPLRNPGAARLSPIRHIPPILPAAILSTLPGLKARPRKAQAFRPVYTRPTRRGLKGRQRPAASPAASRSFIP